MSDLINVLVVDKDQDFLLNTQEKLSDNYHIQTSLSGEDALTQFHNLRPAVVILSENIPDIPFVKLIDRFREIDKNVIRIVALDDYDNIEKILEAINIGHIHCMVKKPVDYKEIRETIDSKVIDYHIVQGYKMAPVKGVGDAYEKLKTFLDQIKEAEKIKAESQLVKTRAIEDVKKSHNKILEVEAIVKRLKKEKDEFEKVKNRDIDFLHSERDQLKSELDKLRNEHEQLNEDHEKVKDDLNEIEVVVQSNQNASVSVNSELTQIQLEKKNGKYSVLFVDDEEELRRGFKKILERHYNVYIGHDGISGLQLLQDNPDISVIITDQRMPEKTGLEMAREAREINADIPIYLLTGYAEIEVVVQAMNDGNITKYFTKPASSKEIIREVEEGFQKYEKSLVQRELVKGAKTLIVDKIKDISSDLKNKEYTITKLNGEVSKGEEKNKALLGKIGNLKKDHENLKLSVVNERKKMLGEMEVERKRLDEELKRKRDEADKEIEEQRERNRAEVRKMQKELDLSKDQAEKEKKALKDRISEIKESVALERTKMLEEMDQEKKKVEADLKRKKEEAEKEIEIQKEKNREALKALEAEFAKEREKVKEEIAAKQKEIEDLKVAVAKEMETVKESMKKEREVFEAELKVKKEEAEKAIEVQKKNNQEEMVKMQKAFDEEKAQTQERFDKEKKEAEEKMQKIKDEVMAEKERATAALKKELEDKKQAFDAENERIRATITKDYDELKKAYTKLENEDDEKITQAVRVLKEQKDQIQLLEGKVKGYESTFESLKAEKGKIEKEMESFKSEYELAVNSREALLAEIASLKG